MQPEAWRAIRDRAAPARTKPGAYVTSDSAGRALGQMAQSQVVATSKPGRKRRRSVIMATLLGAVIGVLVGALLVALLVALILALRG